VPHAKSPIAAEVTRQLERLGASWDAPKRLAHPATADAFVVLTEQDGELRSASETWRWADRAGEFPTDSAVRHFLDGVAWKTRDFTRARNNVGIESSDENYDVVDGGERHVLYAFAYDHTKQYHFAVDLTDEGADPTVFQVDHDGSSYSEEDLLSDFLATLEPSYSGAH
jgi:hypothetical protein